MGQTLSRIRSWRTALRHEEGAALPAPQRWAWALCIVLLVFLCYYLVLLVLHSVRMIPATAELNYAEGTWLFAALRVRYGLSPYFDYSHAPYIPMVYSPLDAELAGWAGALIGASDGVVVTLARLLSFGSTFAVMGGIYVMCRLLGVGRLPASFAALLFFTPVQTFALWSYVARSDMLAAALGLWAVVVVARAAGRWRGWGVGLVLTGGLLAGLAVAAKQTALAPAAACSWWLLWPGPTRGDSRPPLSARLRLWLLFLGGLVGALVIALAPIGLDGVRLLLTGTLDLSSQPWALPVYETRLQELISLFGLVIPVSVLGAARAASHAEPGESSGRYRLLLRYTGLAALVLLVTVGKVGSAGSYDLELIAALSALAGVGLDWLLTMEVTQRQVAMAAVILAFVPLAMQTWLAVKTGQSWHEARPDERELQAQALAGLANGPVLSQDGYIVLHGPDPPYLLDPLMFSVLATVGRWDPGPLRQMAQEKRFSAVVLANPLEQPAFTLGIPWLPDGLVDVLKQTYTLQLQVGRYYVYVPKP